MTTGVRLFGDATSEPNAGKGPQGGAAVADIVPFTMLSSSCVGSCLPSKCAPVVASARTGTQERGIVALHPRAFSIINNSSSGVGFAILVGPHRLALFQGQ